MCLGCFLAGSGPASLSAFLEESRLALPLCGCTRLIARDEDHWEKEEECVEQESFCNETRGFVSIFCNRAKVTNMHYNEVL